MVINDNWVETNEVCPNCGSKVGFNKIETNSTIVLKCKSCGHKISYSNKTAPDYAEYQTQRRIISTQFDEWGDEDVVKEHVKDGLNLLKELKNSKVDKYDLDPMIVLLKIKLFSNNFKEVDDKVYEYIIKYQGATFLCLEDMLVSKSYTNQIAYLLKLQEEKKNEKINKIQKKKKLIKRLITTFMLLLIVAGIGYGAYYQGYLASWGGIFQREFTLTYKLEESGEEKTATVVQGLIYNVDVDEEEVYKKDYAFIGYYGKDGTKYIDASGKSLGKFKNNANLTVYGKWEKVNFILTTNTNAEPNEEDTVQVTKYKTYNVNVPTRADYIFMGYFDKNGTQYIDANGDSLEVFTFNDDLTVYGKWGKRFNLNLNDSSLKSTSKIDGDLSIVYEYSNNLNFVVPTNDYYIFDGWYSQGEGGIKISDNNGNITVTIGDLINSTINLYAHWKQKYEDYTYISNASELLLINNNLNGKYMLLEDVDLSAYPQWTPIGGCYAEQVFTGVFDGNNHIIKNLTRTSEVVERNNRSYFGLFGYAKGATLKNVKFANANIDIYGPNNKNDSMKAYFATLVGYGDNTTIENIETNGKVSFNSKTDGATYLGGIIGLSNNCKVSSIINNQLIWGQREHIASGGICGFANSIELQTCINNASVTAIGNGWFGSGWSYAGGLIGYASNTSLIFAVSCQNNGSLSASTYGWDVGMKEMKKGNVYGNT